MFKKFVLALSIVLLLVSSSFAAELESNTVKLALTSSGHIFNAIAEEQGYLKDEGLKVEYVPVETAADAFAGLASGKIDIASNQGTNLPLQYVSEGTDLTMFAGYMLTGCMPIFTKTSTEWHGIEDLIGKTMACEPNVYAISGPLLDMGHDPLNDITWLQPDNQPDRIIAVEKGEADYGLVGTSLNYNVLKNPNVKIVAYASDILPNYSCCRIEAMTSWVKKNPNTIKALLRAWLRAQAYYEAHHDEAVALVANLVGAKEDFVRAYMDNEHYRLNLDPMKASIRKAWDYMDRLGLLSEKAKQINIDDHINNTLYKEVLDECQAKYGKEAPEFYEKMQAQFAAYNK